MVVLKSFSYSIVNPVFYRSALIYFNATSLKAFLSAMIFKHALEKTGVYKQQRINNVHLVPSAIGKIKMPEISLSQFPGSIDIYHVGQPSIDMLPRLLELANDPAVGSITQLCNNTQDRMRMVMSLGANPTKAPIRLLAPASDVDIVQGTIDFIAASMEPLLQLDERHQRAHDLYNEINLISRTDEMLFADIDYAYEAMFRESMLVRTDEGPITALRSLRDCCEKLFELLDVEAADMLHIARQRRLSLADSIDKEINEASAIDAMVLCEDISNRRRDLAQVLSERFPEASVLLLWRRETASNKAVTFAYRLVPMSGPRARSDERTRIHMAAMIDGVREARGDHYSPELPLMVHRKLSAWLTQQVQG